MKAVITAPAGGDVPYWYEPVRRELVSIRRNRGLTQRELATRCGAKQSSLSYWERGLVVPSAWSLARWATALGQQVCAYLEDAEGGDEL